MSDELRGRRICVTGAGGFIGSAVLQELAERGAVVRALLGPPGQPVAPPPAGVEGLTGEIDDPHPLERLVSGAEVAIHLAGPSSVPASFEAPAHFARVHVVGTCALLEACRSASVRRFVQISSAEVYGQPIRNPVDEDHPLAPRSPYAAAKLAGERFVEAYVAAHGMEAVILRPFSVYGPRQSPRSVLSAILAQVAAAAPRIVLADLRPVRDYCFLDDLVQAVVRASTTQLGGLLLCNIGSGRGVSVAELCAAVLRVLALDRPVERRTDREDRPSRAGILELVAGIGRARRELGWEPATSLEEGLRRTIAWHRQEGGAWESGS